MTRILDTHSQQISYLINVQIDLAEIFVSKALSLLPYASAVLQGWKERMQVLIYMSIR